MKLFFQEYGEGFPIVILHGLFGSLDNWHSVARRFSGEFRVFAVDQRNHGRSPHSETFNYDVMTEDLRIFLTSHDIDETHLVGHSMGGKTAMQFALTHPTMVRKLVVVDISPRSYPPNHDHIFDALSNLDLKRYESRQQIDEDLEREISSPVVRQFLMKNLHRDEANSFLWKMNLPAIRRHYEKVNAPIESERPFEGEALFIRGTGGDYITETDFPQIKRLFPKANVAEVESGHWIHAEAPEEFQKIVLDFLR